MAQPPVYLNLGCGLQKIQGWINVDAYAVCDPDVCHDLDVTPWPWKDESVDGIYAAHVFEHLKEWWPAFRECARVLKPGGKLEIRVPDESSSGAMGWRDHRHVFTKFSFHGIRGAKQGTNAWAITEAESVPLRMDGYAQVPVAGKQWMVRFPRLLRWCATHLRNFIHEQRFYFVKVSP